MMYHIYAIPRERGTWCVNPESTEDREKAYRTARELARRGCIVRLFHETETGLWELVAPEVWSLEERERGKAL